MIWVLAPLVAAVVVVLLAPVPLAAGAWRIRHPRLALGGWLAAIVTGGALLGASLAAALVQVGAAPTAGGWFTGVAITVFAWLALGAVGALLALGASRYESISAGDRRLELQLDLLAASAALRIERLRDAEVCVVDAGEAELALACRGGVPRILVTRALETRLSPLELRAVLEHELAHLRGRHDALLRLARLNAACFPWLRGSRDFERDARLLVELAADDRAARAVGVTALVSALAVLDAGRADESLALRAARLERLVAPGRGAVPGSARTSPSAG